MQKITDTLILPASRGAESMLGQYVLVREAGRGGMSVVYEGRDTHTGRTVAVKLLAAPPGLPPEQTKDMLARFQREARTVAGLSHPNIVAIHELGEQDGRHYLVMDYLRGETLRMRLDHGCLTPAQAVPVLRQIADAVDAVHALGIVHRDIKPSNVMLLPDGTAKLLDFGVARQSDDATITSTGALVGSPAYMAPEQVRGEAGSPASDLWALGALLYEMLAGHPPFTGNSIPSVLYRVTHENPAPIPGLTSAVQRVLRRALDKNPVRRFPNARLLAEALAGAAAFPVRLNQPLHRWAIPGLGILTALGMGIAAFHHPFVSHVPNQAKAVTSPPIMSMSRLPPQTTVADTAAIPTMRPADERRPQVVTSRSIRPQTLLRALERHHQTKRHFAAHNQPHVGRAVTAGLPKVHKTVPRAALRRIRMTRRLTDQKHQDAMRRQHAWRQWLTFRTHPSHPVDDFDAAASARLQKYIWPVGR